ncbi:hypothetical protein HanPSC8_Chr15g0651611 [Helianthus annuus]|nr:hypothetical protein HanPSC8_Chr15g0651611 [Helianthus annuus]
MQVPETDLLENGFPAPRDGGHSPGRDTRQPSRHATGILYNNGRRSSSKKNRTHEKEASAHCFVINF